MDIGAIACNWKKTQNLLNTISGRSYSCILQTTRSGNCRPPTSPGKNIIRQRTNVLTLVCRKTPWFISKCFLSGCLTLEPF